MRRRLGAAVGHQDRGPGPRDCWYGTYRVHARFPRDPPFEWGQTLACKEEKAQLRAEP